MIDTAPRRGVPQEKQSRKKRLSVFSFSALRFLGPGAAAELVGAALRQIYFLLLFFQVCPRMESK
jgi:hypothetical protein